MTILIVCLLVTSSKFVWASSNESKILFSVRPTALETAGFVTGLAVIPFDQEIFDFLNEYPLINSEIVIDSLNMLGDVRFQSVASLLLALSGNEVGEELLYAIGLTGLNTFVLKTLTGMARPKMGEGPIFTGIGFADDYFAFPSGHTSSSFAVATVLAEYYPEYSWLFYSAASLIGLARIYSDEHWPSNVIFGAALGHFSARLILNYEFRF